MYESCFHQGRPLTDWQKDMNYEFSLGELYRMAKEGSDFNELLAKTRGNVR